ncbi:hypothetical protein DFH29DRAFT_806395 [Suillus ampliporus]|nr:hypothetical protein DFH29DRAFT_806395 [Suillus ampliporus]
MHFCLLPTEILVDIFAIVIGNREWISNEATLAALARTCRTFKEPALSILWKKIWGFRPLISCLPEGVSQINMRGELTLKRPLLEGEWRLVGRYSQYICSLAVKDVDLGIIDDRVVQALISAPSPLLPNLRSLVWWDHQEYYFPLLHTLLGSTITSVELRLGPPSFAKSVLLASLGARCPSIRQLDCECGGDSEESSDAISKALSSLRELVHLDTGVINTQALLRFDSLPSLKSLNFSLGTYNIHET